MASFLTILLFFVYSLGLGYALTRFTKNSTDFIERASTKIPIGLAFFIVLGVLFNFVGIPIDWKIFLVLSLLPLYFLRTRKLKLSFNIKKSQIYSIFALIIFLASFWMYVSGAFNYPYLEDDDPWQHALGAKYVSLEKTLNDPIGFDIKYLDSYPPGYEMVMGVLHQTSPSIMWTLKFFNALIVSLSVLIFYFFAKEFTGSKQLSFVATFILASIPAFLSHFIWAHSLVIMLFIAAMYALERTKHDKKWIYPASVTIAAIVLSQPSQALKMAFLFGGYFVIVSLLTKKIQLRICTSMVVGFLISLIWWINRIPSFFSDRTSRLAERAGTEVVSPSLWELIKIHFPPNSGTATRSYTFNDFFVAQPHSMINSPTGLGVIVTLLSIFALIIIIAGSKKYFNKENYWVPVTLFWLAFTFLAVNTVTFNLPIGFFAFRTWMLLAIPVSLLSAFGALHIVRIGQKLGASKLLVLSILLFGILATSGYQKYNINTTDWPPGATWTSTDEVRSYLWLKELPVDTKVFDLAPKLPERFIIGLDKFSCAWCPETVEFRENILELNVEEIHSWLKENEYEYLVISNMAVSQYTEKIGEQETQRTIGSKFNEISSSTLFNIAYQTHTTVVFKVK